jgi:hypothetical protein
MKKKNSMGMGGGGYLNLMVWEEYVRERERERETNCISHMLLFRNSIG